MKMVEEQNQEHEPHHGHGRHPARDGSSRRDHVVISTTIIGVAVFIVFGIPFAKRYASSDYGPVVNDDRVSDTAAVKADSDREAVRAWLRENVDDPHPREIRWWPAVELVEMHRQELEAARREAEDDPNEEAYADQLERSGPDRACRLQYRVRNQAGGPVSNDDVFVLRKGKARRFKKGSRLEADARRYFADDVGTP